MPVLKYQVATDEARQKYEKIVDLPPGEAKHAVHRVEEGR